MSCKALPACEVLPPPFLLFKKMLTLELCSHILSLDEFRRILSGVWLVHLLSQCLSTLWLPPIFFARKSLLETFQLGEEKNKSRFACRKPTLLPSPCYVAGSTLRQKLVTSHFPHSWRKGAYINDVRREGEGGGWPNLTKGREVT